MEQRIITPGENYKGLDDWIRETGSMKILLVCGGSISHMNEFNAHLEEIAKLGVQIIRFRDFHHNPLYANAQTGSEAIQGIPSLLWAVALQQMQRSASSCTPICLVTGRMVVG